MPETFGILGLAGAGKDTAALGILKDHDITIERLAAPLKRAAEKVFGPDFDDRSVKEVPVLINSNPGHTHRYFAAEELFHELNFSLAEYRVAWRAYSEVIGQLVEMSPRQFQQLLGTEVVRAARPNAFVECIQNRESDVPAVVVDTRFENELQDVNFLIVRPGLCNEEPPVHASEVLAWELTRYYHTSVTPAKKFTLLGKQFHVIINYHDIATLQRNASNAFNELLEASRTDKPAAGEGSAAD